MKNLISIVLIFVGLGGIFMLYQNQSADTPPVIPPPITVEPEPETRNVTISVAIAKVDLAEKTVLTAEDFQLGTIKVPEDSAERRTYDLKKPTSIIGYAINAPIAKDAVIPTSILVEPGSTEFIGLFKQPGTIIYTFNLQKDEQYLVDNLKSGNYVDIFLSYERNRLANGGNEYLSPPNTRNTVSDVFLKPLMMHKRVLSLTKNTDNTINSNSININNDNIELVVELSDIDMKILKTIEDRSKLILFPSLPDNLDIPIMPLPEEGISSWPISDDVIFESGINGIREIRGS